MYISNVVSNYIFFEIFTVLWGIWLVGEMSVVGCIYSGKYLSGICLVGEVSVEDASGRGSVRRGSVRRGYVWLGKCLSGMCQVGEMSVGEVSVGEESVGEMSVGDVSGNLDIQAFNLKSFLCGSKRNKKTKLNTNKANIFLQSLLLLIRVSLIWKSSLAETVMSIK